MTALPELATVLAVQDAANDRLLSQLIGANLGGIFVLLAFLRRLRAARRGGNLELHFMYRAAPWYYASGWLLVLAFALALVRDARGTTAIALFTAFVVLWIANKRHATPRRSREAPQSAAQAGRRHPT